VCWADNLTTFICCLEIEEPEPSGTLRAYPSLQKDLLYFTILHSTILAVSLLSLFGSSSLVIGILFILGYQFLL